LLLQLEKANTGPTNEALIVWQLQPSDEP